ncbi:MAG TPA: response regulator [Polyangiaceae bacterium]|nr:response regulator [Polyangiaceae bacterium]
MSSPPEILVVEDEPVTARVLGRLLRGAGYSVTWAISCAAARRVTRSFAVAVLDIDLGDGDGVSLAEELSATRRVANVIFHTATLDAERHGRASRIGAVVGKSGDMQPLLSAVSKILQNPPDTQKRG